MFGSAVVVFREVLEAAMVLGIVLAASRGVAASRRWIAAGVALGAAIATNQVIVAMVLGMLAYAGLGWLSSEVPII